MSEQQQCVHCKTPVRTFNYALGPELMHVDPAASFPTERKGTAWRYCHLQIADVVPSAAVDAGRP